MNYLTKEALMKLAAEAGACRSGLRWLREQTDYPRCLTSDDAMCRGYNDWLYHYMEPKGLERILTVTAEQMERGLTYYGATLRLAYANHLSRTPTKEQFDRGLVDEDQDVREALARRADYNPTKEQYDSGLNDPSYLVRRQFILRTEYEPSSAQIARGLMDDDHHMRYLFGRIAANKE